MTLTFFLLHSPLSLMWIVEYVLCLQFNVIGQLLGFIGSGMYAYYKLIGKWQLPSSNLFLHHQFWYIYLYKDYDMSPGFQCRPWTHPDFLRKPRGAHEDSVKRFRIQTADCFESRIRNAHSSWWCIFVILSRENNSLHSVFIYSIVIADHNQYEQHVSSTWLVSHFPSESQPHHHIVWLRKEISLR